MPCRPGNSARETPWHNSQPWPSLTTQAYRTLKSWVDQCSHHIGAAQLPGRRACTDTITKVLREAEVSDMQGASGGINHMYPGSTTGTRAYSKASKLDVARYYHQIEKGRRKHAPRETYETAKHGKHIHALHNVHQ